MLVTALLAVASPALSMHVLDLVYLSIITNNVIKLIDFDCIEYNMPFSVFYI